MEQCTCLLLCSQSHCSTPHFCRWALTGVWVKRDPEEDEWPIVDSAKEASSCKWRCLLGSQYWQMDTLHDQKRIKGEILSLSIISIWHCAIVSFYHWEPHNIYHKQYLKWLNTEGNLPNRLSHIVTSWPSSPRTMNRVQALTAEQRISWELGHRTSGLGSLSDSGTDSNIIYKHKQLCPWNVNILYFAL